MFLLYIVIFVFVMALFAAAALFPFWKVWARMQTHHMDIWNAAGPFHVHDMVKSPGLAGLFVSVLMKMNRDADLKQRDPEIARWVAATVEVMRYIPKGLWAQIVMGVVFGYAAHRIAAAIVY